jgi:hypothetical protein
MESERVRSHVPNSSIQREPDEIAQIATRMEETKSTIITVLVLSTFLSPRYLAAIRMKPMSLIAI